MPTNNHAFRSVSDLRGKIKVFRDICSTILDEYADVIEGKDNLIDSVVWEDEEIMTIYNLVRYNAAAMVEPASMGAIDLLVKERFPDGQESITAYLTRTGEGHVPPLVKQYIHRTEEQKIALQDQLNNAPVNSQGLKVLTVDAGGPLGLEHEVEMLINTVTDGLIKLGMYNGE